MSLFCIKCKNIIMFKEKKYAQQSESLASSQEKKIQLYCKNCNVTYDTTENRFYMNTLKPRKDENKDEKSVKKTNEKGNVLSNTQSLFEDKKMVKIDKYLAKELENFIYLYESRIYPIVKFENQDQMCANCGNDRFCKFQNHTKTYRSPFQIFYQCTTETCRQIYEMK